jgi:hypothetical protein
MADPLIWLAHDLFRPAAGVALRRTDGAAGRFSKSGLIRSIRLTGLCTGLGPGSEESATCRSMNRLASSPKSSSAEGDDPDGIVVLTREKVADDGFAIGLGGVSLDVGRAELPIVFQHQVRGDVVGTLGQGTGHGTLLTGIELSSPLCLAAVEWLAAVEADCCD